MVDGGAPFTTDLAKQASPGKGVPLRGAHSKNDLEPSPSALSHDRPQHAGIYTLGFLLDSFRVSRRNEIS
jgi:hypothetical protein